MRVWREWAMPSADTFNVLPIAAFVGRWASGVIVDPFARNSTIGSHRNDLSPTSAAEYHMDAIAFLNMMAERGVEADCVLFDPPYSPRQIAECYAEAGLVPNMQDTQSGRFKKAVRRAIKRLVRPGGTVLSFGWNSVGMGPEFDTEEIMLVCHGGDHNDTICMAQRRRVEQLSVAL